MNREQFNNALGGISDDFIEGAAGVYERRVNKKRIILSVMAAGLGLVLMLAMFSTFWKAPGTDPAPTISLENPTTVPTTQPAEPEPTQPSENQGGLKVVFLSTDNGEQTETPLGVGITTPIDYVIFVRDLRGLNDEERSAAKKEWREFDEMMKAGAQTSCTYVGGNLVMGTYMKGFIGVVSDQLEIRSISAHTVNEGIGDYGMCGGPDVFGVSWFLSPNVLQDDPSIPLSTIRDTLEVTVNYKDGTTETIFIDISMNDEGQVFATLAADSLPA